MKAIYRVVNAVPEIHAEPGDHVVIRCADPTAPVEVVKSFDRHTLIRLMGSGAFDQMRLLVGELAATSPPPEPLLSPPLPSPL